ncbi:MAG: NUDIX domain-containing protein [Bacteroidia bacterium]|nr:NUDIX domain-containing protein [Bacteroidia bacterium]
MKTLEEIHDEIINGHLYYLRNVSIDNVIFGYHNKELKVLLQRPQGIHKWVLSGGYIKRTESIDEAAKRIARERTGLDDLYLTQFMAFGNPDRTTDPDIPTRLISKLVNIKDAKDFWMFDYFVSIGYYTLTEFELVKPNGEFNMEECQWWDIKKLPPLLFDHREILVAAFKAMRLHLYHYPIGYELLPHKFTLPEIHTLYETILGKKLDSRNFAKKLISTGIIKKLNERRNIGPHRSPFLYIFDKVKYDKALKNGMVLAI